MLLAPRSWTQTPMLRYAHKKSPFAGIENSRFHVPTISTFRPKKLIYSDFLVLSGKQMAKFHTQLSLRAPVKDRVFRWTYLYYQTYRQGGADNDAEMKGGDAALRDAILGGPAPKRVRVPFPKDAQGFLYLHQPSPESGLPLSESSIRFRCVPALVEISSSYITSLMPTKKWTTRSKPLAFLPAPVSNRQIREAFEDGYDLTLSNGVPWSISATAIVGLPSLEYIRLQLLEDKFFSETSFRIINSPRGISPPTTERI